jgi:hypothetical protein
MATAYGDAVQVSELNAFSFTRLHISLEGTQTQGLVADEAAVIAEHIAGKGQVPALADRLTRLLPVALAVERDSGQWLTSLLFGDEPTNHKAPRALFPSLNEHAARHLLGAREWLSVGSWIRAAEEIHEAHLAIATRQRMPYDPLLPAVGTNVRRDARRLWRGELTLDEYWQSPCVRQTRANMPRNSALAKLLRSLTGFPPAWYTHCCAGAVNETRLRNSAAAILSPAKSSARDDALILLDHALVCRNQIHRWRRHSNPLSSDAWAEAILHEADALSNGARALVREAGGYAPDHLATSINEDMRSSVLAQQWPSRMRRPFVATR